MNCSSSSLFLKMDSAKSVVVKQFGGYEGISVEEYPLPRLEGRVEIKVEYGGINFADLYCRQGLVPKELPFVLGIECSGRVQAIGEGVENPNLKVGQRVICYDYNGGMYGNVIRVSPSACFPLPDDIDFKIGASVFVNYLTAYFSVIEMGNLKDDESILILSCTGGVGLAAVQFARTKKNVKIYGTGSENKEVDSVLHGVDVFIPNGFLEYEVKNHKYDLILANRAGPMYSFLQDQLNPLGRIILIGATDMIKNEKKLNYLAMLKTWWLTKYVPPHELINNCRLAGGLHLGKLVNNDRKKIQKILNHIFTLIKNEQLKPVIHSVWPMKKVVEATKQLAYRRNVGKVLIEMGDDQTMEMMEDMAEDSL